MMRSIARRREIPRHPHFDRGVQNARPAGAGRHHLDREIRTARRNAAQARLGAARLLRSQRIRRALFRRRRRLEGQGICRPQRPLSRAGSGDHRPGRRAGRHHHRHQHGRPRHRHSARRQCRHAHPPGTGRCRRLADPRQVAARGRDPCRGRAPEGKGAGRGRALRARHRTAREPAHRQSITRPLRTSGRSRATRNSSCRSKTT